MADPHANPPPTETLLLALRAKRTGRDRWQARCLAHDDRKPSLSIRVADDRVLLRCHGGCSQEAVLDALRDRGLWSCQQQRERPRPLPSRQCRNGGEDDDAHAVRQLDKARWCWQRRLPPANTPVVPYLGNRGISGVLPGSIGYLPPQKPDHHHAMIAAFGLPHEHRPGQLTMPVEHVQGIHLTLLRPDGAGKAGSERDKVMLGPSAGWPIVLAPPNDIGGLAIAEGIEDALSLHRATRLGAWAAGSASRLPRLADRVPSYVECATIAVDDDPAGRHGSLDLAERLSDHGFEVILLDASIERRAAS
jgi:hypothetical protein